MHETCIEFYEAVLPAIAVRFLQKLVDWHSEVKIVLTNLKIQRM